MSDDVQVQRVAVSIGAGFVGERDVSEVQIHPSKRYGMGRYFGVVTSDSTDVPGVFRATVGAIENAEKYGVTPVTVVVQGEVVCMGLTEAYKRHLPEHWKGLELYSGAPAITDMANVRLTEVLYEQQGYREVPRE